MTTRVARRARLRGLVAVLAGAALVLTGVGVTALTEQGAKAAVLDDFDAANIIDDAVMFNGDTMTAAEIQAFLESKQPTCAAGATCLKSVRTDIQAMGANPMCKAVGAKADQTAAQIIAVVAKACDVNPQVILVMLQKEQTLVTGRTPYSGESVSLIYRKATGLGCPDTAPCDPAKYGLFAQLYGVAYWLVRYTMPAGTGPGTGYSSVYNWFPVGKANGVLYHPNATCGARTITIQNKATASLYYYTPYQPNAAALAAGWGLGNSCSAYGNRNFFLYFTTWFGSTHYAVTGAIADLWTKSKSAVGDPVGNASDVAGGQMQAFSKGTIYTSSAGTFFVAGAVRSRYVALGGPEGALGWPKKAQTVRTGAKAGTIQVFQNGTVYSSSAGTAAVLAPIAAKYERSGGETGSLGYPTGDAISSTAAGGGVQQAFQNGRIAAATGGSAFVLTGDMLSIWQKRKAETGSMGWPTADASTVSANGKKGQIQPFTTGIATKVGTAVRTVTGAAYRNYKAYSGPSGKLGWPTSAAQSSTANGGGWWQRFQNGAIYTGSTAGAHRILKGKTQTLYEARGGVDGTLGWLTSSATDKSGVGGRVTVYSNGRIYQSRKGTVAVLGAILARYVAKDGPKGALGWPTSNARTSKGVTVQTFEFGKITYTAAGGAKASRS